MVVLLLLYFGLPMLWQEGKSWIQRYRTGSIQSLSGTLTNSIVYPIKPGEWITFNIPEGSKHIRVISNAHIQKPDHVTLEDNWKYSLHYQLLDKNGIVVNDHQYHHRSKLSSYRDEQGKLVHGNLYAGYSLTPLDGRLMMLSMSVIKQATSIRISIVPESQEVEEVAVRLYVPSKLLEHRLAAMWLRMSTKHKEILARNTAYSAALLSETEKRNLLKNQWQALGPRGIVGEDYTTKTLYIVKELEQEKLLEPMIAAGLQVDAEHPGVIPIPEQGGDLQLQLTRLDGTPITESLAIQLNWFGRTRELRWQQQTQWLPTTEALNYSVEGGLIQIVTSQPVLVHASLTTASQQQLDVTPKPLLINTFQAKQGVAYQVLHVNNQNTPLRVDIRRVFDEASASRTPSIKYQWIDNQQQLIHKGRISVETVASNYDRLTGKQKHLKVSDPVKYYMNVPADVAVVKLWSYDPSLIVNLYNQPLHYQKFQRVPENAYVSLDKKNWFPSWFQLQPLNQESLIKKQAVSRIAAQYRPPVGPSDSESDQYLWEDYVPLQRTEARSILTRTKTLDYRDEALGSVYCQLQPNVFNQITLKAYGNLSQIVPQLIYIRSSHSAFHVSVSSNQKQILERPAIGPQGIFRLQGMFGGKHNIRINTDGGGKWYMNHVKGCQSLAYLKKRVFKLSDHQLSFTVNYDQTDDRVFSGRFYTAADNQERSVIQASIEPQQEHPLPPIQDSWTFTRRSYDIRPAQNQPSIVMHSNGQRLNSGENFFIAFNRDMPKGQYQINLSLKQGATGFMSLSDIKPGVFEQLRFYKETNDQIQ